MKNTSNPSQTPEILHNRIISMSISCEKDELSHAVLDLARTARRELLRIGVTDKYSEEKPSSYNSFLLQVVLPDLARRLCSASQTHLLLTRDEIGNGRMRELGDQDLRRILGGAWMRCDFSRIGRLVRQACDPLGQEKGRLFATEVIGREPCNGNILEIALSRYAQPLPENITEDRDPFAWRIAEVARQRISLPEDLLFRDSPGEAMDPSC